MIRISITPKIETPPPSRPEGEFRVVKHDIEISPSYLPRVLNCVEYDSFCRNGEPVRVDGELKYKGAPEMQRAYSGERCQMGEKWQWYCFRLLVLAKYGHYDETRLSAAQMDGMKDDFDYLYGGGLAWANGAGSRTNANYIRETNLDADPIKVMAGTCGGHLVKVVGRSVHATAPHIRCEALDSLENPPDIHLVNPQTKPWLFTVSVVSRYDRTVIQFPRSYPLYVPFMDRGGVMELEERRTRPLGVDEAFPPRPFVP
jgi:hypothetical protein